eukprot:1144962-Pelagomonas_calceolata.AAC.4
MGSAWFGCCCYVDAKGGGVAAGGTFACWPDLHQFSVVAWRRQRCHTPLASFLAFGAAVRDAGGAS